MLLGAGPTSGRLSFAAPHPQHQQQHARDTAGNGERNSQLAVLHRGIGKLNGGKLFSVLAILPQTSRLGSRAGDRE